jgi:hypothetical protein
MPRSVDQQAVVDPAAVVPLNVADRAWEALDELRRSALFRLAGPGSLTNLQSVYHMTDDANIQYDETPAANKIWANLDSHFLEPADLWHQILPRSRRSDAGHRDDGREQERVTVDGKSFTRILSKVMTRGGQRRRSPRCPTARRYADVRRGCRPRRGGIWRR